ncbi:hypothetical protein HIM_07040 [Hirsutella minnesotensis 3608]|uniref:Nucleolar protein 12 n=1 Tax=Hirsutella minnesotensis 3608 TaxID=1043627 RepID=A0A0F8A4F4_9HYPO|nr:hypothetical protein HIM_07040 [Hirsutella minnesotensis 3608]
MAKRKSSSALGAAPKAIDPTLDALFASSAGPVKAPPKSRYSASHEKQHRPVADTANSEVDDEELSEASEELEYSDDDGGEDDNVESDASANETGRAPETDDTPETTQADKPKRERKRKRKDDNDDLEANYLAELTKQDPAEPVGKRLKGGSTNGDGDDEKADADNDVPTHESLAPDSGAADIEKANRTIFLGNVSTEAINSKTAKKTLMNHLSSVLDSSDAEPQKLESIRFRSVAFSTGAMPKRAAYITKSFMDATTKSANAYAVFSSPAAVRKVVSELNGTEVLGRHIRVDSIAHPSPTDHRRCVFVGNLGFVDDETVLKPDGDGKTVEKKRNKVPSDVEEGLWRTFGKQGRVENVRVVRDPQTRVGKGFAYVQFYDGNDVESALLLDGKKFPPMLPRPLRVTRAKDPRKTAMAQERSKAKAIASIETGRRTKYVPKSTAEQQATAGRAGKLLGRAGAAHQRKKGGRGTLSGPIKTPEQVVFEGKRASAKDGRPKDLKFGKKSAKAGKPKGRSARRAATWKKKSTA